MNKGAYKDFSETKLFSNVNLSFSFMAGITPCFSLKTGGFIDLDDINNLGSYLISFLLLISSSNKGGNKLFYSLNKDYLCTSFYKILLLLNTGGYKLF